MKVTAVYNHKGGIGKTVSTVNLGYNLTVLGKSVLLLDADPQGNLSTFFNVYDLNKSSIGTVLVGKGRPDKCIRKTRYQGLDIVPGNLYLQDALYELERKEASGETVAAVSIAQLLSGQKYDYCIIDCPPSAGRLIGMVMEAADDVIIPLNPDRFSADGLGSVLDIIRERGSAGITCGCLFTKFYRNKNALRIIQDVMQTTDAEIYENVIRRCSSVDHSLSVRKPLLKCASKSTAAIDYMDFTREYLEKEGNYGTAESANLE